ncbi:MAG TPA: ATP-binding protein [Thermoanaerobaculia bacterium]|nr:ATP-binding protein [Thermoanaerobaculia bacterium]
MIPRTMSVELESAAKQLPVVTLTGPRQSGKTTLCRAAFPRKPYVNLEPLDNRELVRSDPRGFLSDYPDGAILDEIQNVPELLSYIQADVDENPAPGRFILTGSQQLAANEAVSQTLAGRTTILHLLPFSLEERRRSRRWTADLWVDMFHGGYPRVYDQSLDPVRWYGDYVTTYIERDVRQVREIGDLRTFRTFVMLAAGRTAQEINLSSLGNDAGVSHNTARSWLSILEASYITISAAAWHRNIRKQIVKAPKLHFLDSGVACSVLGIRDPDHLKVHPLRGAIFESWVAGEIVKGLAHRGRRYDLMHYRESRGVEIDIVVEQRGSMHVIECKSGATIHPSFLDPLLRIQEDMRDAPSAVEPALVYGGSETHLRRRVALYSWSEVSQLARRVAG